MEEYFVKWPMRFVEWNAQYTAKENNDGTFEKTKEKRT